jgi:hypothetical protein
MEISKDVTSYFNFVLKSGAFMTLGACVSVCVRLKDRMSAISTGVGTVIMACRSIISGSTYRQGR